MRCVSIAEAENGLSALIDAVQAQAVAIKRKDGSSAVLLSQRQYESFQRALKSQFDNLCDRVSKRAVDEGLTEEKLAELLNE